MKTVKIIAAICAGLYRSVCLSLQGVFPSYTGSMPQSIFINDINSSENSKAGMLLFKQQCLLWLHAPLKIENLKLP